MRLRNTVLFGLAFLVIAAGCANLEFSSKVWSTFLVLGIIVYLIIAILSLDILQIHKKWSPERASLFALDTYAHKDHVTMKWSEPDDIIMSFEGSRWSQYVGPYQIK